MIKSRNFRESLGITQEEAAMLLKTTKSQIAMFELGLRELPTAKMLKLVTMYNHVQHKQQEAATSADRKTEDAKCIAMLERELKRTEEDIFLFNYELERLKAKYQKSIAALELAAYLETELPEKEMSTPVFAAMLRSKAQRGIEKYGLSVQLKCELTIKTSQHYQKELKKELERIK